MILSLDAARFPMLENGIRALWAPILLEPISGSHERFVIGVAAANQAGFHVEVANALDRLNCFYGADADAIRRAISLAEKCLREDLARRSVEALRAPDAPISGVYLGECREVEGRSLEGVAQGWMASLSSLYDPARGRDMRSLTHSVAMLEEVADDLEGGRTGDRLPFLVCDYVKELRAGYGKYFSSDLRNGAGKRVKGGSHRILIDYAGPRLVANFGTLKAGSITSSVHLIKRRLWDLKVERDREPNEALARVHEMILQRPPKDDPQVSTRQQASIDAALNDLEEQADQEKLHLLALDSVSAIGQRIMRLELAA